MTLAGSARQTSLKAAVSISFDGQRTRRAREEENICSNCKADRVDIMYQYVNFMGQLNTILTVFTIISCHFKFKMIRLIYKLFRLSNQHKCENHCNKQPTWKNMWRRSATSEQSVGEVLLACLRIVSDSLPHRRGPAPIVMATSKRKRT